MKRFRHVAPDAAIVETVFADDGRVLRIVGLPNGRDVPHSAAREMDCTLAWEERERRAEVRARVGRVVRSTRR